jgi:hypothetical protein
MRIRVLGKGPFGGRGRLLCDSAEVRFVGGRERAKAEKRYRPDRPFFEAQESVSGGEAGVRAQQSPGPQSGPADWRNRDGETAGSYKKHTQIAGGLWL